MVERWLAKRLYAANPQAAEKAKKTAEYFNRSEKHKSHGRRIDRDEARMQGLEIENLEDDGELPRTLF
jgi:hypothetical protein